MNKFCSNPACPVGCPDSHTLPNSDEEAIAMGLEPLLRSYTKEEIEHGLTVGRGYIRLEDADPEPMQLSENIGQLNGRKTTAEIAASISGLRVGLGRPVVDRVEVITTSEFKSPSRLDQINITTQGFTGDELTAGETLPVPDALFAADTPEEPVRSWSEEFARFRKMGDFGADALADATEHIKKWPKGFKTWNEQKQVAWLDEKYPLTDSKGDGW